MVQWRSLAEVCGHMYLKSVPLSSFGPVQKYWSRLSERGIHIMHARVERSDLLAAEIKPRSVSTSGAIECCVNTTRALLRLERTINFVVICQQGIAACCALDS